MNNFATSITKDETTWRVRDPLAEQIQSLFLQRPSATFSFSQLSSILSLATFEDEHKARKCLHNMAYRNWITRSESGLYSANVPKILERRAALNAERAKSGKCRRTCQGHRPVLSPIQAGHGIIALIDELRKKNGELEEQLTRVDIDKDRLRRLVEDNRVLNERVTQLTTQLSAANNGELKL